MLEGNAGLHLQDVLYGMAGWDIIRFRRRHARLEQAAGKENVECMNTR